MGRDIHPDSSKPIIMTHTKSYFFRDLDFEQRKLVEEETIC